MKHDACTHPRTPAARAACRRSRNLAYTLVWNDSTAFAPYRNVLTRRSFPTVDAAIEYAEANVLHNGRTVPNSLDDERLHPQYEKGLFIDGNNLMAIIINTNA